MAHARLISVLVGATAVAFGALACRAAPAPAAPALASPTVAPLSAPVPLPATGWETVRSARQGIDLPLPARRDWVVNDRDEPWLVAQHAPSRSELRVRTWRAPRANAPEHCVGQARLWRPDLPSPTPNSVLEARPLVAPEGYRGTVDVGGFATDSGATEGYVVAVGARTGRCFALWYRTRVMGEGAEATVAENLAVVSGGLVDRVRETRVEDIVERVPSAPGGP